MNVKKIKDFLFRVRDTLQIQDEETYKRLTIRIRHQGVSLRDEARGTNIGTKSQFWAKGGQFIVSKIDARWGAFGIIPDYIDKAIITGNFWTYEIDTKQVTMEWFHFFTSTEQFVQICKFASTGVTNRQYLDEKTFLNLEIPLPSLVEQEAIVQKIKGFMATHSQAKAQIEALQTDLKAYRKSILQEAIKGNFTATWRANNPTEKIDLKTLKKENTKKQKPLAAIKIDEMHFELPQNWSWVRLGEGLENIKYGTSKKCESNFGKTPVLRIPNVVLGKLNLEDLKYADFTEEERKDISLNVGDLLLIRSNGSKNLVGKTCIYDNESKDFLYAGYLIRIRPVHHFNSYYLQYVFETPFIRNQIEAPIRTTTGVHNINSTEIQNLPFPLPPLTEQAEIVRILEEKMATIAAAEEQLKALLAEQSLLQKSMMQEVFRG
ncbi:MAG: restriction endonuclease subunit S [Arcicella sp.]|jgi:type I restriction enzyme S subunit|nr:restriction endonuclease subunit S [Arcicella sp.]